MVLGNSFSGGPQIQCPNCGTPFAVQMEQLIDAGRNPSAKARLISGRLNVFNCPNCGYPARLAAPLIYHDLNKELLISFVPMEIGLQQAEQERIIGSLTQAVIKSIPTEQRKGYLFTPKQAFTLQGLIEMVLEADGITKEMLEARRQKVRLVETFLQSDPEQWVALTQQFDQTLDREFFEVITASAEAAIANGRRDVADQLMALRETLLEHSTEGKQLLQSAQDQEQVIQEVANGLNALGKNATYESIVQFAVEQGQISDARIQVIVGLARPLLNESFFGAFDAAIAAANGATAEQLTSIRDRFLDLSKMVDESNQAIVDRAMETLNAILTAPDLEQGIAENIEAIDDTFLQVVNAGVEQAERQQDMITAARYKKVLEAVMQLLDQAAPPPVQFVNQLLSLPTLAEAVQTLTERAAEFGPELLDWLRQIKQQLIQSGGNPGMVQALNALVDAAAQIFNDSAAPSSPTEPAAPNLIQFPGARAEEPASKPAPDTASEPKQGGSAGIVLPFSARKRRGDE